MSVKPNSPLTEKLHTLGQQSPELAVIQKVVHDIVHSLQGDIKTSDVQLHAELCHLRDFITNARQDLASLSPEDIAGEHISTATDELEAVVAATEEAANKILDAAEQIQTVADAITDTNQSTALLNAITIIYEASNFQDITGQRISKVVKALQQIDEKLSAMMDSFDKNDTDTAADNKVTPAKKQASVEDPKSLLNGPQLPNSTPTQDDIDALFDSLD